MPETLELHTATFAESGSSREAQATKTEQTALTVRYKIGKGHCETAGNL